MLENIKKFVEEEEVLTLEKDKTAVIVVDMVNGFVSEGVFGNPLAKNIIENIVDLNEATIGQPKAFFLDKHTSESREFKAHPNHCLKNDTESELIPELKGGATIHSNTKFFEKNSINGMYAPGFKEWINELIESKEIDNLIITGLVTDLCVFSVVNSLVGYLNESNIDMNLVVPRNCTETFEFGLHERDFNYYFTLYNMKQNGVKVPGLVKIV